MFSQRYSRDVHLSWLNYETKFKSVIRRHHVHKVGWSPVIGEKLKYKKEKREEATGYDDFAVGLLKESKESSGGRGIDGF